MTDQDIINWFTQHGTFSQFKRRVVELGHSEPTAYDYLKSILVPFRSRVSEAFCSGTDPRFEIESRLESEKMWMKLWYLKGDQSRRLVCELTFKRYYDDWFFECYFANYYRSQIPSDSHIALTAPDEYTVSFREAELDRLLSWNAFPGDHITYIIARLASCLTDWEQLLV